MTPKPRPSAKKTAVSPSSKLPDVKIEVVPVKLSAKAASHAVSPARREAFVILLELEKSDAHADTLLRSPRIDALSSQDRHLATTLVMGTLRWQIRLDALIRPLLSKPNARLDAEIRIALRLGAFQLLYLDRIPAHAAIGESVALAKLAGHKFASGMVNAVLRKLAASSGAHPSLTPASPTLTHATSTAHPAWLVERWVANYGLEATRAICEHGQRAPVLTLRLDSPERETELAEQGIALAPGLLLTAARRVLSGDIPAAFKAGHLQIQDEGSQLIAELASAAYPGATRILDACAAPGGKTLILAERLPHAQLTACELNPARLAALRNRLAAIPSASNVQFLEADAAQLPGDPSYDLALVDAPCSGTGTLDRNPEIRHRLQPADLARHHDRQSAILQGVLRACEESPDARVLYSTCSLEPEENSQVVAEVLAENPRWQQLSLAETIQRLASTHRLVPEAAGSLMAGLSPDGAFTLLPSEAIPTDGFYAALLSLKL